MVVSPSENGITVLPTTLAICECPSARKMATFKGSQARSDKTIVLFTFVGSGAVGKLGYFQPFLIVGRMLATIGGGLIYTFDIGAPSSKFIGYQVVARTGISLTIQIPTIVAQATSTRADVSIAMSTMLCKSAFHSPVLTFSTRLYSDNL
jgi:hypothetical protein